jgi:hypothetical protein
MDWIQITEADMKTFFTEYEWSAIDGASRASGASDVVNTTINRVVNRVRGYVESCEKNVLGAAGYVPALLYDSTMVLLLKAMSTSLPASGLVLDTGRQEQIKQALAELKMVAQCELKISPPGSSQDVADDSPAPDTGDYGGCDPINFHGVR